MKITNSGPEYTHLVLMREPEWSRIQKTHITCLDIGTESLQKLFDYEDVLQKHNIEQSSESLEEYIQLAEKGIQCLKIVKNNEEILKK